MKPAVMTLAFAVAMALGVASMIFSGAVARAQPTQIPPVGRTAQARPASVTCYQYACDGVPVVGSTCQLDGQRVVNKQVYSKVQPGKEMFEFSMYISSSCDSVWSVITNESGGRLSDAFANLRRSLPNENEQTTGPVSLSNGASAYSPMLGMVEPQDTLEGWVYADDLGNKSVLYSPNGIVGGGHG